MKTKNIIAQFILVLITGLSNVTNCPRRKNQMIMNSQTTQLEYH